MTEIRPPPPSVLDKYRGDEPLPLYTGRVSVSGGEAAHGRASGIATSDDGALAVALRLPHELGGAGGGTNPEQLLAASYAACFHGAMTLLAKRAGLTLERAEVEAAVTFSRDPFDGFYLLSAQVRVHLPGLDPQLAAELVRNTERVCPYAKMFQHGITHHVSVVEEQAAPSDQPSER